MRDRSVETLPPFRDPREELTRYRYRQAGAGLLFALALASIVVLGRLENDPTSLWGRMLTALAAIGGSTYGLLLVSTLLSHVVGSEDVMDRSTPRPGALFSGRGSIATEEADAHPRLVALAPDIDAHRRRLRVRVELRPGQMFISRAGVGANDESAARVALGSGELVSADVVPLIYGCGLAVSMRDGTAFAVALRVSATTLSSRLSRWRETAAASFSFPGAEHYAGFLPVIPAATTPPMPDIPAPPMPPVPRIKARAATPWRRRRLGIGLLAAAGLAAAVTVPVVAYQATSCGRARHLIDQANEDLSGYFGQIKDLRTVYPPGDKVPVAVGYEHSLSAEQIASARKDPDAWRAALRRSGFTGGWIQLYLSPLGLNEQVFQFGSHKAALDFQAWATQFSCGYTAHVFTVPTVQNTIGLEIRYKDSGNGEQVSFVRGARRYLIGIRPTTTPFPTIPVSDVEVMTEAAAMYAR